VEEHPERPAGDEVDAAVEGDAEADRQPRLPQERDRERELAADDGPGQDQRKGGEEIDAVHEEPRDEVGFADVSARRPEPTEVREIAEESVQHRAGAPA